MTHRYLLDGTKLTKPQCEYHQNGFHAVMDYRQVDDTAATPGDIQKIKEVLVDLFRPGGFVTYTQIHKITGIGYPRIFAAIKALHRGDPYLIRFEVNRLNENTMVRITRKEGV